MIGTLILPRLFVLELSELVTLLSAVDRARSIAMASDVGFRVSGAPLRSSGFLGGCLDPGFQDCSGVAGFGVQTVWLRKCECESQDLGGWA